MSVFVESVEKKSADHFFFALFGGFCAFMCLRTDASTICCMVRFFGFGFAVVFFFGVAFAVFFFGVAFAGFRAGLFDFVGLALALRAAAGAAVTYTTFAREGAGLALRTERALFFFGFARGDGLFDGTPAGATVAIADGGDNDATSNCFMNASRFVSLSFLHWNSHMRSVFAADS